MNEKNEIIIVINENSQLYNQFNNISEELFSIKIVNSICQLYKFVEILKLKINELEQASEYIKWVNVCK